MDQFILTTVSEKEPPIGQLMNFVINDDETGPTPIAAIYEGDDIYFNPYSRKRLSVPPGLMQWFEKKV